MADIGFFSLKNDGLFVARLEFEYFDKNTNKWVHRKGTGDITVGNSQKASPGDYGVPEGSLVRLVAFVVWGSDNTSGEQFTYKKCNGNIANYTISGTTLINNLKYDGITPLPIPVSKADISFISLKNEGGFVARLEFQYFDKCKYDWVRTKGTGDITLGNSKTASPGDYGVPEGSLVRLFASVVLGSDNTSNEAFTYKKSNGSTANYTISGTTLNNKLKFDGIQTLNAEIEFISLINNSATITRLEFEYFNKNTDKWVRTSGNNNLTCDIVIGTSIRISPGDYGVPNGSLVRIYVNVVGGFDNNVSLEMFTYIKGNGHTAIYTISGILTDTGLKFDGIKVVSARMYFNIQLKTKNGYFVCAENGGGRELVANRTAAAEWETFTLAANQSKPEDNIKVGLIARNGRYVTAVNGGGTKPVTATKATQGEYETFTLRKVAGVNKPQSGPIGSGDKVAFCCASGKHYLSAQNGGGSNSIVHCEPPWMDVDEMFTINLIESANKERVMTSFVPKIHGFHFNNNFTNVLIDIGSIKWTTTGRCGGMAFAALDYFYKGRTIPATTEVPPNESVLAKYIYGRLIDSFLTNGAKFVEWTTFRGDYSSALWESVPQLTKDEEFPKLMNALRTGPVPLGIISSKNNLGDNHQVVAIGAELDKNTGKMTVYLYDNNHHDEIVTLTSFPTDLYFTQSGENINSIKTVRGFFVENYGIKDPPVVDEPVVITVPQAPRNVTVTPGNGQVTLRWDVPSDNGGSPITGYQVFGGIGTSWAYLGANVYSYTFTGLTNGTAYTFRVAAYNTHGVGAPVVLTATPVAGISNGIKILDSPNIVSCNGVYTGDDPANAKCFQADLNKLNRNHFKISFDFMVKEYREQWALMLSKGWRILGLKLKSDGKLYITTNNQAYEYDINSSYQLNTWYSISVEYYDGKMKINNGNWFNVNLNTKDGDNHLSSNNYSNAISFKGDLRNIVVVTY